MSMKITTFKKVVTKLPHHISVIMRGDHGVGKSDVARSLAHDCAAQDGRSTPYRVIDWRLSQMSEGDIVGLPSIENGTTRFNPNERFMAAVREPCILFLDEFNRATNEVMQLGFQIILDRELNGVKLHPKTRVFAAVNANAVYTVNEVDPALLDRFWVADLVPDMDDWLKWAKEKSTSTDENVRAIKALFGGLNCNPMVTDFIQECGEGEKWLDPGKNFDPTQKHPSRRSWERLGDAIAVARLEASNTNDIHPLALGFVGVEAAIKFCNIISDNAIKFSGEDIVERYETVREKLTKFKKNTIFVEAVQKVADYVHTLEKVNDHQGKNIAAFMKDIPGEGELKVSLWSKCTSVGVERLELIKSFHEHVVDDVLAVFGTKRGKEGLNMKPNIPATLDPNNKPVQ